MSGEARAEAEALIAEGFRVWPISRKRLTPAKAGFARANGPDVCATPDDFGDDTEVGVLCGPCPAAGPGARFVCVDYDGPVPPDARVGGASTLTSKQGAHAWYRVPPGVTGFRQTQSVRYGAGPDGAWAVDTRDFGGYARETKNGEPLWDDGPVGWPRDLTQAEVDGLFGPVAAADAPTPEPRPAVAPPTSRTVPSVASTNALATRWHTNPDNTNQLAGAVGAVLGGAWGWSDDQVREYFATWLQHPSPRHLASALRAAERYRAGDRIYGFPTLEREIGRTFEPTRAPTSADDLWALIEATPEPGEPTPADGGPWRWRTGLDIAAWDPPPIPWLSEELCLAPGAPGLITGFGGTGKTTFAQHLALAVVSGGKLLGEFSVRQGAVTHLDYEQGQDLTMRRYLDLGLSDLPAEAQARLRFASFPDTRMTDDLALAALLHAARGQALLIIDSLVAASVLDDENAAATRKPLDMLGQVSELTGCVVLVIHHSKKDRQNGRTSARGSSAITDAVSVHITYERDDKAGAGAPVELKLEKVRHIMPARSFALAGQPTLISLSGAGKLTRLEAGPKETSVLDKARAKFDSGWEGTAAELQEAIGARRQDTLDAIRDLIGNIEVVRNERTRVLRARDT